MVELATFGKAKKMVVISFKGRHFQRGMILQSVRWYLAYSLSYRDIEAIMQERGFDVDHSTIHRWVIQYAPLLEQKFRQIKRKPCGRWRLDETFIKVKGEWKYYIAPLTETAIPLISCLRLGEIRRRLYAISRRPLTPAASRA